jgi:hypothetical protein
MAATKNKNVPTDDAYYVSAADLADKIIAFMHRGCNPLQLSRRTRVLFQTSRRSLLTELSKSQGTPMINRSIH